MIQVGKVGWHTNASDISLEVPGANFGWDIDYPDYGLAWISSVSTDKCMAVSQISQ
jgi:hypothetical protein